MIRVLVADGMSLVRGALVALLSRERDIEVVAEVEGSDCVVATALQLRPHVAVLDVELAEAHELTVVHELHAALPQCPVLILTEEPKAGMVRRAIEAHANGLLAKDIPANRLAESVRKVAQGERVVDPALAVAALDASDNPLTPRELDVLRAAAEGSPASEIAARLHLAPGTVRNYLSKIISKTGARTRIEAIRITQDAGWL